MSEGFRTNSSPSISVSDDLRRGNIAAVARALLVDGPLARAELAEKLSLTRATVTRTTAQLIDAGLVREADSRKITSGRPMIPLELNAAARLVISVHIGALELRVGVVNLAGQVVEERRHRYSGTSPAAVSALIRSSIEDVLASRREGEKVLGVSASVGGRVDPARQVIAHYQPLGWREVLLEDVVPDVGLPRWGDQMVRGLALAERMFGVGKGHDDFVVLWSGNVLGSASVVNGDVQRGLEGAAGGIDHLPVADAEQRCACGRDDCLSTSVTDAAIEEAARRRGVAGPDASLRELVRRADGGDSPTTALLAEKAKTFGRAAGIIADLRAPALMILAGLVTTAPGYASAFREGLREGAAVGAAIDVRVSEFGDLAPTIASAAFLIDEYFKDPLALE